MEQVDSYRKTDEIVAKFKNGEERYKTSPTFNRVVQMLVRDCDIYEVIDQLITITDDTQKAFEQYVCRDTRPMSYNENSSNIDITKYLNK